MTTNPLTRTHRALGLAAMLTLTPTLAAQDPAPARPDGQDGPVSEPAQQRAEEAARRWEEWARDYATQWQRIVEGRDLHGSRGVAIDAEEIERLSRAYAAQWEDWAHRHEDGWRAWADRYGAQWQDWARGLEGLDPNSPEFQEALRDGLARNLSSLHRMPLDELSALPSSPLLREELGALIRGSVEGALAGLEHVPTDDPGVRDQVRVQVEAIREATRQLRESMGADGVNLRQHSAQQWQGLEKAFEQLLQRREQRGERDPEALAELSRAIAERIRERAVALRGLDPDALRGRVEQLREQRDSLSERDRELDSLRRQVDQLRAEIDRLKAERERARQEPPETQGAGGGHQGAL